MQGEVVRRSGDKTVAVVVKRVIVHPMYQKRSTAQKTYLAHDPNNKAQVGDVVAIKPSRPLSRRKRWIIVATVSSAGPAATTA